MTEKSESTHLCSVEHYRQNFRHTKDGIIYLNHASVSPLSDGVKKAVTGFLDQRNHSKIENFEEGVEIMESCRRLISQLIHAEKTENIAFTKNTSDGISLVAEGLPLREGDEILLNKMEFPSNVHPWRSVEQRKHLKIRFIDPVHGTLPVDLIEKNITQRTRVIAVSVVQFLSGYKSNLYEIGRLCREKDILLVVDGIQGLGVTEIDVSAMNIDALATGGHKWLMSPLGIGFLYLGERILENFTPVRTGWFSVEEPWDLLNYDQPWLTNAQRLEDGTPNMLGITGMNASLKNLLDIGIETISARVRELTDTLIDLIQNDSRFKLYTSSKPDERAGIVTFKTGAEPDGDQLINELKENKISISHREGFLRIAPHYYNTPEELQHVFEQISSRI